MGDEFEHSDFSEAFLRANANADFIAAQVAKVIRNIMRAVTSADSTSNAYTAAKELTFVCDLLRHSEKPLSLFHVLDSAIQEIRDNIPDDPYERKVIEAAMRGAKYLVESSADDNAARGRASVRLGEFEVAIRRAIEPRGGRG